MKTIKLLGFLLAMYIFFIGCKSYTQKTLDPIKGTTQVLMYINTKYDSDFPPIVEVDNKGFGTSLIEERFKEGGRRFGKTGIDDSKEGKWLRGDVDFDESGNVYAKGKIWQEEYFKNGLRDSIYRCFDSNGKIIYETTFKKGTGHWKEFHSNGQLYFDIYTRDGYFTDTLKIHDDKGRIVGKRLYIKDSLVYNEGLPCFPYRPDSLPSD